MEEYYSWKSCYYLVSTPVGTSCDFPVQLMVSKVLENWIGGIFRQEWLSHFPRHRSHLCRAPFFSQMFAWLIPQLTHKKLTESRKKLKWTLWTVHFTGDTVTRKNSDWIVLQGGTIEKKETCGEKSSLIPVF